MSLSELPVVVVVFWQKGCPACEDYVPRFRKIAEQYGSCLTVLYVDLGKGDFENLIGKFQPAYTPTTVVWRPPGWRRPEAAKAWSSALTDPEIASVLELAGRAARCEV